MTLNGHRQIKRPCLKSQLAVSRAGNGAATFCHEIPRVLSIFWKPVAKRVQLSLPMKLFGKEASFVPWCFPVLLLLSGCGEAGPDCGTADVRNSVVKIVSDDRNNRLLNFAIENSDAVAELERTVSTRTRGIGDADAEAERRAIREKLKQEAIYVLDESIAVNSRSRAAAVCSGILYIRIGDTTVEKELEFRVEQAADGKISVSVKPFAF